jgi:hypothetical protein
MRLPDLTQFGFAEEMRRYPLPPSASDTDKAA